MRVIDIINQFRASERTIHYHQQKGFKTEIEILKLAAFAKETNISSSFIEILKTEMDSSKNLSLTKIKKYKDFLINSYTNSESFLDKAIELYQINLDDKKLKALKILLTKNKRENDTTKLSSDSKYILIDEEDFSDENFYDFE